ncbi:hypothetical protein L292_1957 [Acinetobacter junii CIP 107470 = MTCC 11364]|uniref:Uncharacterized protein n=1 Tax=Acinetobacter junii CIP 107470 = MTCC 11364 TaxID=1217666 RepID=S7WY43_ACIJU|nr:hypothetical protein [Acinetobacter junii]ENV52386.1 hypothetical protein F953_00232 [Acinetobacter junii CIP 107470 = MTCC 11364]EPR86962.1 hypothetical protein L292_1957 [Acinetobacter junii CIP 107470 = MTCC 11364]
MGILDKLNNFTTKCAEGASKLEEKTAKLAENAKNYAEEERVKDFYKIKDQLIEINKKQKEVGIEETTIFDFFKDRPEYADLLELERNKQN